jgi:hypothetical protein
MPLVVHDEFGKVSVITSIVTEQIPDHKEFYVTGTFGGGFGPYDMRMSFYDSKIEKIKKDIIEKRQVKTTVIMSYASAKQLYEWLGNNLKEYEGKAGHEIYIGSEEQPQADKA